MPAEAIHSPENVPTTIPVESFETTLERVHFVAAPSELTPFDTYVYGVARKSSEGQTEWAAMTGEPSELSKGLLTEIAGEDDITQNLKVEAAHSAQTNKVLRDTIARWYRWWDQPIYDRAKPPIKEAFSLTDGERSMQVLNMSGENVSDQEMIDLTQAFQTVVNFTGGKIFDRVKGVTLQASDEFDDGAAGYFLKAARVAAVNVEDARSNDDELNDRYKPYFEEGNQPSRMAIILAHELGHAMDVDVYLDKTRRNPELRDKNSAFDYEFGWTGGRQEDGSHEPWTIAEDKKTDCGEIVPTEYAETNPSEDFAETFALLALGVDRSRLPERFKVIADTIQKVSGEAIYGPKQITAQKLDSLKAQVPDNIYVRSFVETNLLAGV